ncbi:MAG: sugar O-acetyltransferase [Solirubrobacterales bacterium]|nr:sugar O-acetyltransferase [Solirubrobacterales bacterium]
MTEREKMLAGEPYDPRDPELVEERRRAQGAVIAFNAEPDEVRRLQVLRGLLGSFGDLSLIVPPFFCDYGTHLHLGYDSFVNTNSVFLDCAEIRVGDHARIGPGVQVLAADHPREPEQRVADFELAAPVTIGARTWIGAGAIICPGVTIGEHSIVGAGSVVVRDVPERVMAAGNPCRVIREL